jgi:5-methylcytosine-specific restriction protein B
MLQTKTIIHTDYSFDDLYLAYTVNIRRLLNSRNNQQPELIFKSRTSTDVIVLNVNDRQNITLTTRDGSRDYLVSKKRMKLIYDSFSVIEDIKNVVVDIDRVIGGANHTMYWTMFKELKNFEKQWHPETELPAAELLLDVDYDTKRKAVAGMDYNLIKKEAFAEAEKYVLIIDEINRGNISQIFGELITLIEPDKRAGMEEHLKVQLPYSKDSFSVPPNLFIIGTMNTADRSVEALDTALRRRFSFKEMLPDPDQLPEDNEGIPGIKLSAILKIINLRIEKLLDKDHQIGHAYFINVISLPGLRDVFRNKILPLLQEYFYGDTAKIGMVLGGAFIESREDTSKKIFDFDYEDGDFDDTTDRKIYRIASLDEKAMSDTTFLQALKKLQEFNPG